MSLLSCRAPQAGGSCCVDSAAVHEVAGPLLKPLGVDGVPLMAVGEWLLPFITAGEGGEDAAECHGLHRHPLHTCRLGLRCREEPSVATLQMCPRSAVLWPCSGLCSQALHTRRHLGPPTAWHPCISCEQVEGLPFHQYLLAHLLIPLKVSDPHTCHDGPRLCPSAYTGPTACMRAPGWARGARTPGQAGLDAGRGCCTADMCAHGPCCVWRTGQ